MSLSAAINGCNDVDFPHGANYKHLQEAIDKGLVKPEVLERAVKDVLRQKFRAGLFDKNAYLYSKEDIALDTPEERQTALFSATMPPETASSAMERILRQVKNISDTSNTTQ